MVARPGQFDTQDFEPDSLAIERLSMFGILAMAEQHIRMAHLNLVHATDQSYRLGDIGESAKAHSERLAEVVSNAVSILKQAQVIYTE